MLVRNVFVWSVLSSVLSGALSTLVAIPATAAEPAIDIAQVNNADLACYLNSPDQVQYDLTALCGGFTPVQSVVLQTGDVQVTLRWNTSDDLDLYVKDPAGDEVYYGNPAVASGGQLDIDANLGCVEQMAEPVENIFWPTGGGVPGNYVIKVDLFQVCGTPGPIPFTLTTLIRGETSTQTGTLSEAQRSMSFPFTFPAAGTTALPTPPSLPAIPRPAGG
jgi:hypothetical protein